MESYAGVHRRGFGGIQYILCVSRLIDVTQKDQNYLKAGWPNEIL